MRTLDEKWEIALPYYERAGRIAFKDPKFTIAKRPTDEQIEMLYTNMVKLLGTYKNYVSFYPDRWKNY